VDFVNATELVLVGSSFSNGDVDQLETESNLEDLNSYGLLDKGIAVDFQTRGQGAGREFGVDAPRIHVVNSNGDYLVERFESPAGTVNDYAVILGYRVGDKTLYVVAGIRDIGTRAAAFVMANSSDVKYSTVFGQTNAILVHATYSTAVNTAGLGSYTPAIADIGIMKIADISGTQPIPT
jgi:hypothetical protein